MLPFGPRGSRLWAAYCERADGEAALALLEEICRTADRLDRLDAMLTGREDDWLHLVSGTDAERLTVVVDGLLAEARQQGAALTRLIAALPLKGADDDDGEGWLDMPTSLRDASG